MGVIAEPAGENGYLADHADLLCDTYRHWTGRDLVAPGPARAETLYRAPFVVLSHNTDADPLFTYANLAAQTLFEMPLARDRRTTLALLRRGPGARGT